METRTSRRINYNVPEVLVDNVAKLGSDKHLLKCRVIRYQHPLIGKSLPMFDIRQFVENKKNPDGTIWSGFTSSGVSLTRKDLQNLLEIIPQVITKIDELNK